MKNRTALVTGLVASILLMTSCTGSVGLGPTSTPDPLLLTYNERVIWDFEKFRDEVNNLAAVAADTPAKDLEPILHQMTALKEEIQGYEFPLSAPQAHSVLTNFALNTEQCYFSKYAEYLAEISGHELIGEPDDRCDQAQVYEETLDLYLQELKEMNAED